MIKLVATDIDGTLLRTDGTVSDRTRAAIAAATDAGLMIAFATGRPPRWLDDLVEATEHHGVAVGANGAVLYDLASEQVVSAHYLSPDQLLTIALDLRAAFPQVSFGIEYGDSFAAEPEYIHEWQINPRTDRHGNPIPPPLIADLTAISGRPALKLLAKDEAAEADGFLSAALDVVGGRASLTHSSSYGLLEIGAAGVTKASGLAELAALHGIAREEVVAIGDMPNDVPMLHWAGRSYAVANAHPAAKEAAGGVVGSNDEDAVAVLIESLL
jgi:Cof subfamily protein (haloacid dehalogenase superfamily)